MESAPLSTKIISSHILADDTLIFSDVDQSSHLNYTQYIHVRDADDISEVVSNFFRIFNATP